ncbi:MAG TPA: amino acid ABC transporter permease, partial [Devosia sp.]|nr:amino acid ABC transporter permease [Devosia sp.]
AGTTTSTWSAPTVPVTGFFFAAMVFWIFTFTMSRYSQYMEKRLDTGHKN